MPLLFFAVWLLSVAYVGGTILDIALPVLVKEREKVRLDISPRLGTAPVRIHLRVWSEEEGLTCPHVRIEWEEGQTSEKDSDCSPEDIPEVFLWERWSPIYYGAGTHEIRVYLSQGSRKRLVTGVVTVVGS